MSAPFCCVHLSPAERVDEFDLCAYFDSRVDTMLCGPHCPAFASAHAVTERVSDAGFVLGADAGDDEKRASEGE